MTLFETKPLGKPRLQVLSPTPANASVADAAKFAPSLPAAPYQPEITTFSPLYLAWNGYLFDGQKKLLEDSLNPRTSNGVSDSIRRKTRWQMATFSFLPVSHGERIVVTDRSTRAFYHWMTEALAKMFLVGEEIEGARFLLPTAYRRIGFVERTLDLIGSPGVDYVPELRVARIGIGHLVTPTAPLGPGLVCHDGELLARMADRMKAALPDDISGAGEKIFLSRAKAARRHLVNESEVRSLLEAAGFTTVHFEDCSLDEQIGVMQKARIVVSQHGAGLANIMFMRQGSTVVEITGRHIDDITYFQLARALGHDYLYVNGDTGAAPALDQHADMVVPIEALQALLCLF